MSVENPIIEVSFCGTSQKAVKPKRSVQFHNIYLTLFCSYNLSINDYSQLYIINISLKRLLNEDISKYYRVRKKICLQYLITILKVMFNSK